MNGDATKLAQMKSDGTHSICIREDMMERNLGADRKNLISVVTFVEKSKTYLHPQWSGEFIALYTGANGTYFQIVILDADWVVPANA